MKLSLLYLAAVAITSLARPATSGHRLHERRDVLPNSWSEGVRLTGQEVLPVRIGLAQSKLDEGHDLLMDISNPSSPRYGKHLSADEVHDLFAPSEESVVRVSEWLESEGISKERISQSVNKQWLQFDASAGELERLLRAEYYSHSHLETGKSHIATREYHIPRSLQSHIDYITPGVKLLEVGSEAVNKRSLGKRQEPGGCAYDSPIICQSELTLAEVVNDDLAHCDQVTTPACIRAMYNVPLGTTAFPSNELGVYETLNDVYSQTELDVFFSSFASEIPRGTHPILHGINGAEAPTALGNSGPESSLDFEVAYPLIYPQNAILFQTDDPIYQGLDEFPGYFNNFLDAIDGSYCDSAEEELDPPYPNPAPGGWKGQKQCGVYKPTNVVSISYGGPEADLPVRYLRRQCHEWMKLGLQGVSVVVAAGNQGVEIHGCLGENRTIFSPGYIGTCPYVTTVGATYLPKGGNPYNPEEIAVDQWSSSGGFSNIWKRPSYQSSAVEEYFARANVDYPYYETVDNGSIGANGGIYNRIGRGFPDVAAVGEQILVYFRGQAYATGGTSASAPIFASLLTRINEERLAKGMPTLGFVNPVLYQHPEMFRDVTVGNSKGCGTDGFAAVEGWDPVSGLGTPDYQKLLEVFMGV